MLRYEEFSIDLMKSYIGKNYIDIRIKSDDPLVPCEEYTILANNDLYPLIPTGFPAIGGYSESRINYLSFLPKKWWDYYSSFQGINTYYYDIVKNIETGNVIPNLIRLYFYDVDSSKKILASSSSIYKIDDKCERLCDAVIGREAPFFLIKGNQSPLFNAIRTLGNKSSKWDPSTCVACDINPSLDYCNLLTAKDQEKINSFLFNEDCSSKLLTRLLGFLDTDNSLAQVGPIFYSFAINTNLLYKSSPYVNTVQTANITYQQGLEYQKCALKQGADCPGPYISISYASNNLFLDFKLPVCKNDDGTYSFYLTNYMFLKLLNPVFNNQTSGSQIVQVRSSATFANGSNDRYIYSNEEIDGVNIADGPDGINPPPSATGPCSNLVPSLYPDKTAGNAVLSKDVDNLFAKIKFSSMSGSCSVDNPYTNEVIYFEGNVTNLDEFVVQLIDYQGRILQTNKDHCFTLMIVEKIEVLKDTNINTRTGFVNSSGSDNVIRNNYAN